MKYPYARALAASVSVLAIAPVAQAQTAGAATEAAQAPVDSTIIVTGSRAGNRTVADSTVPVDVISADSLQSSGYTETNKVLNQLVPSFNFPQPSLTDGTDSLRPATLRGLAPDQVLVLVNGKRRHAAALLNLNGSVGRGSSSVDLNEIPPIALERVEVLRDGAASLYGSDAIAGVINLQLSKRKGVRASATYGKYVTTMDGVQDYSGVTVDAATGLPVVTTAGGGNNDILGLNYTQDRERHDGDTLTLATNVGLPIAGDGYLNLTAQFRDRDPTNRAGADRRRQYPTVGDPRELTFDRFSHRYGDGKSVDFNFFVNGGYDLGGAEFYTFGSYGIRDANGTGYYRRANDSRNRDYAASTTTFVPYYPNGFLPQIDSEIEDVSGALGVRGEVGGLNADLSVVYGSNELNYAVENSFNVSLGGVLSPQKFDAGGLAAGQTVVNLDLSRDLSVGFLQKLGIAFGAEYRNENFKIRAGDVPSYINGPYTANGAPGGAQVFPGFRPSNAVDASRHSWAGYVEADADVSDALSVQLAGRYENYSDFGDTLNGKVAARFEIVPGVAIRGSASTGFRAPSLGQQYFATTSTNNIAGVGLVEVGTFPVNAPIAVALGSKPLKAEKSTNFGAGIALDPFRGFNLTIDYYNIKIEDRVVLTENLQGAAVVALIRAAGLQGTSARFFVNGVDTRTQGLDVVGSYSVPDFGFGKLRLTAGFNYNETKILRRAELPSLPGLLLFGRVESFRLTDGQPRDKINLGADWDYGKVGASVRTNRYGEVFIAGSGAIDAPKGSLPADYTLSPKWITDIEVKFRPIEGVEVAAGADNVFDVYPDNVPVASGGSSAYYLPYSGMSPFGFNGRFLYTRVALDF